MFSDLDLDVVFAKRTSGNLAGALLKTLMATSDEVEQWPRGDSNSHVFWTSAPKTDASAIPPRGPIRANTALFRRFQVDVYDFRIILIDASIAKGQT
jgi:hypothetical protein